MDAEGMKKHFETLFEKLLKLRDAGQKEYAHAGDNPFQNFERIAAKADDSREKILMIYFEKHLDGIWSWIKGHRSQRESVLGRIEDAMVYLGLLHGMASEAEKPHQELDVPVHLETLPERRPDLAQSYFPKGAVLHHQTGLDPERFDVFDVGGDGFWGRNGDGRERFFLYKDKDREWRPA